MEKDSDKALVLVGRIGTPYGVRGWLKVKSYTDPIQNLLTYQPWQIRHKNTIKTVNIVEGRPYGKGVIVQLEGCDDRDKAIPYINSEVLIDREQLPTLEIDEYYWADLIGLTVTNQDNQTLGIVDHLFATGSNDVMVVKGLKEIIIPFRIHITITSVDLKAGLIKVNWNEKPLNK